MLPWLERPSEIAYLLNPAFCGEIIRRCAIAYSRRSNSPFPFVLVFLVLPLVLHASTRSLISRRTKKLINWIQSNPEIKVGFASRARNLVLISRESLLFLLQNNLASISVDSGIVSSTSDMQRVTSQSRGEIADCYKKAEILGEWFSRTGNPTTIFAILGVKP